MTYLKQAFGQNLRLLRKARGLTQEKLAELVNLNQRQLTRIENGTSFVSSDVLEKLVMALNIEIKELFDFNLKEIILSKTGSDNIPHYRVIKNDNVIRIQKFKLENEKPKVEEEKIIDAPDKYLINVAKKLNKPITAQHFKDEKVYLTYIYHPNGKIDLIRHQHNETENEKNKLVEDFLNKIKKIIDNEQQIKYINLAFDSLTSKKAREKLKILIEGMNLLT